MKSWGDIEKELETLKYKRSQAYVDDNYHLIADYGPKIDILEWVLDLEEGEASHFTWTIEWGEIPPRSEEEIRKDMEDYFQSPNLFFKYLKEKSDENNS